MLRPNRMQFRFWLRTNRPRPLDGRSQLCCRITVPPDPARVEVATGVWLLPTEWAGTADTYAFAGLSKAAEKAARKTLDDLKADLDAAESDARGEARRGEAAAVTAERIKELLPPTWRPRSKEVAPLTVAAAISEYLAHREALRGTPNNEPGTLDSLQSYARHFLRWWGADHKPTLAAGLVSAHHGRAYLDYLKELGGAPDVTNQRLRMLEGCWQWHGDRGRLSSNPFRGLKVSRGAPKEIVWLEPHELARLEAAVLTDRALTRARWLFCVACYTGLAWADLTAWLTAGRPLRTDEGRQWLVIRRRKTRHHGGGEVVIPVLPGARRWLDTAQRLAPHGTRGKGPLPHYETNRCDLIALGAAVGLPMVPTTHTARKTFGMLLLNDGVRIETVSLLLGHSSIAVTQKHYARILSRTVVRDLERAGLLPPVAPAPAPVPRPAPAETLGRPRDRAARFTPEELAEFDQ